MAIDPDAAIHPTAIVDPGASIGAGAEIGPYCLVGAGVRIGQRCRLRSHVVIEGDTTIGEDGEIWEFVSIGHRPQHLRQRGTGTRVVIGPRADIRQQVTIERGTESARGETVIGADCLLMVGAHVAHDCVLGNHVVLTNAAMLGGHAELGDHVIIGAGAGIHQHVRIGRGAMIGAMSAVPADVIPFGSVMGERAYLAGLNLVGLKRRGTERAAMNALRAAFARLFAREGTLQERARQVAADHPDEALVQEVVRFLSEDSHRSFLTPR